MYIIKTKVDSSIGGIYPQASCNTQSIAHSLNYREAPKEKLILEFELRADAILTDVISQAAINANGLLLNQKVRDLISSFNLLKHLFIPVDLLAGDRVLRYFWLHLVDVNIIHHIDYSKSKFYRTEYGFREEDLTLDSFSEYTSQKELYGKKGTIESELLVLKNGAAQKYDIIAFPYFDNKIYVSESLRNELIERNITGLNILQLKFYIINLYASKLAGISRMRGWTEA